MKELNQEILKFEYEKILIMMIFLFQKVINMYTIFLIFGQNGKKIFKYKW